MSTPNDTLIEFARSTILVHTTKDDSKNLWIYWTIVGAIIFIGIIIAITLWDLVCRVREKMHVIPTGDGGPPATPTHCYLYTVGCHADQASPSLDTELAIIRIELLDNLNRYVTSIAIPCFLLKFKQEKSKEESKPKPKLHPLHIKSLSILHEKWAGTDRGELITFDMSRRHPLLNVTSARITHDCYAPDATLTLKYIAIYDQSARVNFMINLKGIPLKAIHPCPPSGLQVYPVEKVGTHEDLKSFTVLNRPKYLFCCPCIGNS